MVGREMDMRVTETGFPRSCRGEVVAARLRGSGAS